MAELPNKTVIPECKLDGTDQVALRPIEKQGFHLLYLQESRAAIELGRIPLAANARSRSGKRG